MQRHCGLLRRAVPGIVGSVLLLAATQVARAQTDEIQVYNAQIAPVGVLNLTDHMNYTPDGRTTADYPGGIVPSHSLNGGFEWAYGITSWWEQGLYMPLYSLADGGALTFNGFKVRELFVSPHAATRTFYYGLNFEFSYNTYHWSADRYDQEMRPILGWRFGPWDLILNPILDNNYKGFRELDFAPASRIDYNFNKTWAIAVEEYDDFGHLRGFHPASQQQHTIFGKFDYSGSVWSVEGGVGMGMTAASDKVVFQLWVSRDLN